MKNNLIQSIILSGLFLFFSVGCKQKNIPKKDRIKEIVARILEARSNQTRIPSISRNSEPFSLDQAYEVQTKLTHELSKFHGPVVGYKLGYSDSTAFKKNNISVPAYGPIFRNQIVKSGAAVPASDFHNFALENEIVFTISKTIDRTLNSVDELVPFVKSVHIGFDMSETVFLDPTTITDFVADAAGSKYFVLSEGLDPGNTDITDICLSVMLADTIVYEGKSKNVLGNPWFALREVANDLIKRGNPLKSGYVIFSGKVAPAYKIKTGKAKGLYKGVASPFSDIFVRVK